MVTFKNGRSVKTIAVYGGSVIFQQANRDSVEIIIPADELSLEEAKTIWQDSEVTAEITVTDGDTTSVKLDYVLPVSLTMIQMDEQNVIKMKLGQKTYIERLADQHTADISVLDSAVMELGEILGGGNNG